MIAFLIHFLAGEARKRVYIIYIVRPSRQFLNLGGSQLPEFLHPLLRYRAQYKRL